LGVNVALVAVLGGNTWIFVNKLIGTGVSLSVTGPRMGRNDPIVADGDTRASKETVQLLGPESTDPNENRS
jgi:hypothetical protein